MVYQCPTINLTTFSTQEADYVVSSFRVTWQSVLLLTSCRYQEQKATLVITLAGKTMVICQPLTSVLHRFFTENCIGEAENRVYYQMIQRTHATRSAVAGRYQLVPTCGPTNDGVVWVMTHHLAEAKCQNKRENCLILQFNTASGLPLIVTVQSCAKSYLANMEFADQVSHLQLELGEFQHFCRGLECSRIRPTDYQRRRKLRQQLLTFNELLCTYQHSMVMKHAFEQRELSREERYVIGKHGFRPFKP